MTDNGQDTAVTTGPPDVESKCADCAESDRKYKELYGELQSLKEQVINLKRDQQRLQQHVVALEEKLHDKDCEPRASKLAETFRRRRSPPERQAVATDTDSHRRQAKSPGMGAASPTAASGLSATAAREAAKSTAAENPRQAPDTAQENANTRKRAHMPSFRDEATAMLAMLARIRAKVAPEKAAKECELNPGTSTARPPAQPRAQQPEASNVHRPNEAPSIPPEGDRVEAVGQQRTSAPATTSKNTTKPPQAKGPGAGQTRRKGQQCLLCGHYAKPTSRDIRGHFEAKHEPWLELFPWGAPKIKSIPGGYPVMHFMSLEPKDVMQHCPASRLPLLKAVPGFTELDYICNNRNLPEWFEPATEEENDRAPPLRAGFIPQPRTA